MCLFAVPLAAPGTVLENKYGDLTLGTGYVWAKDSDVADRVQILTLVAYSL